MSETNPSKGIWETVKEAALSELIKYVVTALIMAILASGFAKWITSEFQTYFWHSVVIYVALVATAVVVALIVVAKVSRRVGQVTDNDDEFLVISKKIRYEYHTMERMTYTREVRLRVLRGRQNRYEDRYSWTGSGSCEPRACSPGQSFRETYKSNVWTYYEVAFGRTLKKNEEVDVVVEWHLVDSGGTAVPFASLDISETTQYAKITVVLPSSFGVKKALMERTPGSKKPDETQEILQGEGGSFEFEIKDPLRYHRYDVRWDPVSE